LQHLGVVQGTRGPDAEPPRDARGVEDVKTRQATHQVAAAHHVAAHGAGLTFREVFLQKTVAKTWQEMGKNETSGIPCSKISANWKITSLNHRSKLNGPFL